MEVKGSKEDICSPIEVGFQKHNKKYLPLEGVLAVMVGTVSGKECRALGLEVFDVAYSRKYLLFCSF